MAMRLALGCETSGYRTRPRSCKIDCCPKPVVVLTDVPGIGFHYQIDDADSAQIVVECDGAGTVTSAVSLTAGKAGANYALSGSCLATATASNECGDTIQYWRNYSIPKACDCIVDALDPPSLWGKAGTIVTTITGSVSPAPLIIGGITVCPSPSACGDITGSYVKPCGTGNLRWLITTATGCSNYHYFIDVLDLSSIGNYPSVLPGYGSRFFIQSGWFQKASNPYPTLTPVTVGTNIATLLGVGAANIATTRDVVLTRSQSKNFAPGNAMLACYRGTLIGVGAEFLNSDTIFNSGSVFGNCDLAGLVFDAEVVD